LPEYVLRYYDDEVTFERDLNMSLIELLKIILEKHAHIRVNGKLTSERTVTAAKETLHTCFKRLYELGYKLERPENIAGRHIEALCRSWYNDGMSPKTMQSYLPQLRIFSRWIGKTGLVKNIKEYLTDVDATKLSVKTNTQKSKSWAEHGIDVVEKVREAMFIDKRFGYMIMAQVSLGLRRMEVLQMRKTKCTCMRLRADAHGMCRSKPNINVACWISLNHR
jgi:site-specific recombinase XerC